MSIMNAYKLKSTKKSAVLDFLILNLFLQSSCAYRLTNLHSNAKNNIKTIHVEAVYDTGAEALPHERLWDELQHAIAANGQLKLTSAKSADAILRAHLKDSGINRSGPTKPDHPPEDLRKSEPNPFDGQSAPAPPGPLRSLNTASLFFSKSSWYASVDIEVWDLRTRKMLLQRTYPIGAEILDSRPLPAQIFELRHEEAREQTFTTASRSLANRIISDLLVH